MRCGAANAGWITGGVDVDPRADPAHERRRERTFAAIAAA
jgi:hypothetical protein